MFNTSKCNTVKYNSTSTGYVSKTNNYTADTLIKKLGLTNQYTSDLLLVSQINKSYTNDLLLKALGMDKSYSSDTLIKKLGLTNQYTSDLQIKLEDIIKLYSTNFILVKKCTNSYSCDIIIQGMPVRSSIDYINPRKSSIDYINLRKSSIDYT